MSKGYQFERLLWTDKMAYNVIDETIRVEAYDSIPWAGEKWNTTNCMSFQKGKQVEEWDSERKCFVWKQTDDIVFFGGLSEEEQEKLVPIIARGLTARLLRASNIVRGKWFFVEEEDVINSYKKQQENGLPFDDVDDERYRRDISDFFIEDSAKLMASLPDGLYQQLEMTIKEYTRINCSIEHSSVEMKSLLQIEEPEERDRRINDFIRNVNKTGVSYTDIGRLISDLELMDRKYKYFVNAMYDSKLFDTKGKTKEQYYESIKKGFIKRKREG